MSKVILYVFVILSLGGCSTLRIPCIHVDRIPDHHGVFLHQALKDHLERHATSAGEYTLRVSRFSFSKIPLILHRDGNTGVQQIRVTLTYDLLNALGDTVHHQTLHLSHADTSSMARQNFIIDEDPMLWQKCAQAIVADIAVFHKTFGQTPQSPDKR